MTLQKLTFRILRFKPGRIDPPAFRDFAVSLAPDMTVLDGLEQIRLQQEPSLMYRRCCHHASCGTCACTINGTAALACATRIAALDRDLVILKPLENHVCIGDLAVDMRSFFRDMDAQWSNLRPYEDATSDRTPAGVQQLMRLENCIECGCCVAACPVASSDTGFVGPSVLAAVSNELRNRPADRATLLRIASRPNGVAMCRRHLVCSRVCPANVYPARHIADLKRIGQTSRQQQGRRSKSKKPYVD